MKLIIYFLISIAIITSGTGCQPYRIVKATSIVDKGELVLPAVDPYRARLIKWMVIDTSSCNIKGTKETLFALTPEDYKALGENTYDIIKFGQQQQLIIKAYKEYYNKGKYNNE